MNSQQGWWCYASEQAHCLLQCLNCLGSFIFAQHSRWVNFSFYSIYVCVCARWLSFVFFNTKNEFYLHTPLGRSFHSHCGLMEEWAKIAKCRDWFCVRVFAQWTTFAMLVKSTYKTIGSSVCNVRLHAASPCTGRVSLCCFWWLNHSTKVIANRTDFLIFFVHLWFKNESLSVCRQMDERKCCAEKV